MRRTLDWLGRDFVHLALLVSLLRTSPQVRNHVYSSVGGGGGSLIGGLDSYSEALSRHKAVLDDLHDLSRPLRPLSPSLLSATHHHPSGDNDVIESFIPRPGTLREISAYVLQHQQLADPVQDLDSFPFSPPGSLVGLGEEAGSSSPSGPHLGGGSQLLDSHNDDHAFIDSGVSDVSSETASVNGRHALSPRHLPDLEALDEEDEAPGMEALFASASGHGSFSPAFMDDALFADFDLPSPGGLNDGDLDNDLEGVDSRDLLHVTSRSGSSIGGNAVEGMDVPLSSSALPFSPDEEDVENQLMHIDDQLIRLDGSIDNIEQGVDSLNGALIGNAVGADDDESMMDLALLGREDQEFLFSSLQDNWRHQTAGGAAASDSSLSPTVTSDSSSTDTDSSSPKASSDPVEVKQEIKEEPVEHQDLVANAISVALSDISKPEAEAEKKSDLSEDSEEVELQSPQPHLIDHNYAAASAPEEELTSIKVEDGSVDEYSEYYFSTTSSTTTSYYLAAPSPTPSASSSSFSGNGGAGASSRRYATSTLAQREARDAKKARAYGIPFSLREIIDSSMEKFNDLVSNSGLTDQQMTLCRDIRRRGKNKVAAQNCRRRKLDLITNLSDEIVRAREYKQQLLAEREHLYRLRNEWSNKLLQLEESVLRGMDRDPTHWELGVSATSAAAGGATSGDQVNVRARRRATGGASASSRHLAKPARA